jgi:hypothetical protein
LRRVELKVLREWLYRRQAETAARDLELALRSSELKELPNGALRDYEAGLSKEFWKHHSRPDFWVCYNPLPKRTVEK